MSRRFWSLDPPASDFQAFSVLSTTFMNESANESTHQNSMFSSKFSIQKSRLGNLIFSQTTLPPRPCTFSALSGGLEQAESPSLFHRFKREMEREGREEKHPFSSGKDSAEGWGR